MTEGLLPEGPLPTSPVRGSAHGGGPSAPRQDPRWDDLEPGPYRTALRRGMLRSGLVLDRPSAAAETTVVFVHGQGSGPRQFARHIASLRGRANPAAFLYDDSARLIDSAERLRAELLSLPEPIVIVAYSLGTLLSGYVAATDTEGRLRTAACVYLNPLIGGSRYADADRLLAALDQRPSLQWLHVIKRRIQRAFFAPVVQDLTPESDFQQTIFGFASPTPIFAGRTVIFLTEKAGSELDIRPERTLRFFGRTRAQLLERMGTVASLPPDVRTGHRAPLDCPEIVEGLIDQALARAIAREGPLLTSPVYGSAHGGGTSA